jgi:uncharacterized protein with FMN-binding domain
MRRLLLALASTAAGLAAVLSYKTHGFGMDTSAAAASTGTSAGVAVPAGDGAGSADAGSDNLAGPPALASRGDTAGKAGTLTLTGAVAGTQYGPMQVQVTLLGREITGIKVLQQTDTGTESQQIDATAIPKLTMEALAAQSARIDAVSGASYTSSGYIQSLQSALDKARA